MSREIPRADGGQNSVDDRQLDEKDGCIAAQRKLDRVGLKRKGIIEGLNDESLAIGIRGCGFQRGAFWLCFAG
jgi:hypothetical protein